MPGLFKSLPLILVVWATVFNAVFAVANAHALITLSSAAEAP
jgi:hypothetical protein